MTDCFSERERFLRLKRSELVAGFFVLCGVCACAIFFLIPAVAASGELMF